MSTCSEMSTWQNRNSRGYQFNPWTKPAGRQQRKSISASNRDREELPTATDITSLCKFNFLCPQPVVFLHIIVCSLSVWKNFSLHFALVNSIGSSTTLPVQKSHGLSSWENQLGRIFGFLWACIVGEGKEGSVITWVTLERWLFSAQLAHSYLIFFLTEAEGYQWHPEVCLPHLPPLLPGPGAHWHGEKPGYGWCSGEIW